MPISITGMFAPSGGAGSFNLYDPADMAAGDVDVLVRLIAGGRIYTNGIAGEIVIQTGAGTPSHSATEGTLYWDTVANILYCNNNGTTGWTAIGAGGAGTVGAMGAPGVDGVDGADGWPIPGPAGAAGRAGAMGAPGSDGVDGMDGWPIPGPAGTAGGKTLLWFFEGVCSVRTHGMIHRFTSAARFSDVQLSVPDGDEPTNAALEIDIETSADKVTWTTIFSTKPHIDTATEVEGEHGTASVTAYSSGWFARSRITAVGSTLAGNNLTVALVCT